MTHGKLEAHVDIGHDGDGAHYERRLAGKGLSFIHALQSQVVCHDVPKGGATIVVAKGPWATNPIDPALLTANSRSDFCPLNKEGYTALRGRWEAVDGVRRGSMIIWVSRLPHANKLADMEVSDATRAVVFVCWMPTHVFSCEEERKKIKKRKVEVIKSNASLDHWPCK
eukprot:6208500-Pleurochrysis_carterae.AAC.1